MTRSPSETLAVEPLNLARALIRCPSVTPADAGALDILEQALRPLGFACRRMLFAEPGTAPVDNLYARLGTAAPNFCFAGHTDVVPPGDASAWSVDPFAADIRDGHLIGRGAADMKGALACFVAAVDRYLRVAGGSVPGSISLLVTGDEEGPAINGTRKVLSRLAEEGEALDGCLVGEPTNHRSLGETIKIGRRGSLNARITVKGVQGHAAYPERADNPLPRLIRILGAIDAAALDAGTPQFQPSTVTITSVDVGNPASNVIPAAARAALNVRFNDRHSCESIRAWLEAFLRTEGGTYTLETECSGEAFLSPPGRLCELVVAAVERVTGRHPELGTSGGTSDARFIKGHCPVVEFGLPGETAHRVNESVTIADLEMLTAIYESVLEGFFGAER